MYPFQMNASGAAEGVNCSKRAEMMFGVCSGQKT
jgi:hypothetical protein